MTLKYLRSLVKCTAILIIIYIMINSKQFKILIKVTLLTENGAIFKQNENTTIEGAIHVYIYTNTEIE